MPHINQKIGDQLFLLITEYKQVRSLIVLLSSLWLDSNNSKMYQDLEVLQTNTSRKWID